MKKTRRITRSFVAFLMAAMMFFSLPSPVYAYIGAIVARSDSFVSTNGTFKQGTETYAFIQNDYIHFDICIATTDGSKLTSYTGSHAHTIPTSTFNQKKLDDFGVQNFSILKAPILSYDEVKDKYTVGNYSKMTVTRVDTEFDTTKYFPAYDGDSIPYELHGDLVLKYTVYSEHKYYTIYSAFNLVKLNEGSHNASDMDYVYADDGDTSVNWGVECNTYIESNKIYRTITDKDGQVSYSYVNENNTFFKIDMEYVNFAKTGHDTIKDSQLKDIAVGAETRSESGLLSQTVISNGVSSTEPNSVTEVYCDSYSTAAPFVACSYYYYYSMAGGVQGHEGYYPESVEFANNTLTTHTPGTWAFTQKDVEIIHDQKQETTTKYAATFQNLWGYRNLMVQEEMEQQQIQPDKFDIHGSAQYLCVFPNGTLNGKKLYTVKPAANANEIKTLESTYGKSVAQYRGDYSVVTANDGSVDYYKFISGVCAISPSITATWNAVNSYFRLRPNGNIEFDQNAISLNSPTFKFYSAKDGGGLTFDGYDDKLGVKFGIKPDKNSATINISLPGNSVQVKGASVDTKGNLVFTGKFKMNLFVAQMEMLKLGYGLNSKAEFVCNGVHAKGKLKVPKAPGKDKDDDEDAKPNVLGFGGASMEGEVNTFPGEELYDFKFQLTIKNLFSTKAELTLVRLKNGRLCPEHLYFELKAEAEGAGIDLTPGTPVVTITGGGGGIDGLASTIDGNYTCIPPVVLTLVTYGTVTKVVNGKLTAKIGPSILKLSGEDLGFKIGDSNLEIVDSMYAGIYLTGKEITYGTNNIAKRTYRGVTFGGALGIGVKIFNFKDDSDPLAKTLKFFNNTISASASLGVETFAGGATDGSNWMYLYVGAYGNASCSLNIPAGVPAIGGKALLGAALDFKIGAQTAFETGNGGDSAKQFFKNASITGGIAATGYVWPVYGRVIYILPDKVKFQGKLFKELDELDWDDYLVDSSSSQNSGHMTMALSDPEVIETEDGEQALAYVQANIAPIKTRVVSQKRSSIDSTYTKTVTTSTTDIPQDEKLVLAVVPKNPTDINALEESITCDKLASPLNWVPDVIPATDSDPGYNAWRSTYEAQDDGTVKSEAIYLSLTREQATASNSKTTITASVDFDVRGLATTPVTGLTASITNDTLSAKIDNPENAKQYALYTYFGTKTLDENGDEQITTDYAVEGRNIDNNAAQQAVILNSSGDIAPTGDYYVTTALVEKTTVTVQKDDGTEEDIDAEIPVSTWVSPATYHYVNTTVPTAPEDVELELIGNESMKASWKKANNADGYKLTIYQKDGDKWVDTERGYNLANDDFTSTQGLAYDEATQTYSIEMAMTVGGDGEASTITSSEGDKVTIDAAAAKEIKALEAGKTYKVTVQSYKSNTILIDEEVSSFDEYSEESESGELKLPVYKPVKFDVYVDYNKVAADGSGLFNTTVNQGNNLISVDNFTCDGNDVSADTTYEVSIMNLTDDEGNDYSVPLNEWEGFNGKYLPDFDGTIGLEISAKYKHDGVTDETLGYLYISKDNVAPVISLDKETFYADKDGNYTITGTTEPGAKVYVPYTVIEWDDWAMDYLPVVHEKELTVDANGKFSYKANVDRNLSVLFTAYAKDECGNKSDAVSTIVVMNDISKASVTGITNTTYTGKAKTMHIQVSLYGNVLDSSAYKVAYKNNVNAGTATVTITGTGSYKGTITKTFTIAKIANPMTVKAKKPTVKAATLVKKKVVIKRAKAIAVTKAKGKVTYKLAKKNKNFTVAKNGKITVKKGVKKGTYKVKIKVTAAGNVNYKKKVKTVTVKIKVT